MTRRLIPLLVALVLIPAVAQAHVLTITGARRTAERDADRIAESFRTHVDARVGDCTRRSNHTVDCTGIFDFSTVTCHLTIRVSFRDRTHRWVRTSYPFKQLCFST